MVKTFYDKYFKDDPKRRREPVIVEYVRTPLGSKKGRLKYLRGDDMAVHVWQTLKKRVGDAIDWEDLSKKGLTDSIIGCNSQIGAMALDVGKTVPISAGFPMEMPGTSVNRQCASGMQTVFFAMQQIASGDKEVVLAGGVEAQNSYPIMADINVPDGRGGVISIPPNPKTMLNPYIQAAIKKWGEYTNSDVEPRGQIYSAEVMGRVWHKKSGLTFEQFREKLDSLAVQSHTRAGAHFEDRNKEIEPIEVPKLDENGNPIFDEKGMLVPGQTDLMTQDEGVRPVEGMMEKLKKLRGIVKRKTGYLTAGNSCPTTDGAAGMIITSREFAEEHGLKIRGSLVSFATVGTDYILMLTGPIHSIPIALERAGMTLDDMDSIEINEAFSTVVFASCYELGLDLYDERLNKWGGAMAIGHPTGMTGTRLIGTIIHQLETEQKDYGIASLCVGLGMGAAAVVKREGA